MKKSNTESIFKYENIKMSSIMTSSHEDFYGNILGFFKDPLPSCLGTMQHIHSHIPLKHACKASIIFYLLLI